MKRKKIQALILTGTLAVSMMAPSLQALASTNQMMVVEKGEASRSVQRGIINRKAESRDVMSAFRKSSWHQWNEAVLNLEDTSSTNRPNDRRVFTNYIGRSQLSTSAWTRVGVKTWGRTNGEKILEWDDLSGNYKKPIKVSNGNGGAWWTDSFSADVQVGDILEIPAIKNNGGWEGISDRNIPISYTQSGVSNNSNSIRYLRILPDNTFRLESNWHSRLRSTLEFNLENNYRFKLSVAENNMPVLDGSTFKQDADNNLKLQVVRNNKVVFDKKANKGSNIYNSFKDIQGVTLQNGDTLRTINIDTSTVSDFKYSTSSKSFTKNYDIERDASITDSNLLAELNNVIGQRQGRTRASNSPIWISELQTITGRLNLSNKNISNIQGLELCTSIQGLDLKGNNIKDMKPLANLTQLGLLDISGNPVGSIGHLSKLTNLGTLRVNSTNISDLTPLIKLTKLRTLNIDNNKISDLRPLSNITSLNYLNLGHNNIEDITPIKGLNNLTYLRLASNKISDIRILSWLTNLTNLNLDDNNIENIKAIETLNKLTHLYVSSNKINDVKVLQGLNKLNTLYISNNELSNEDLGVIGQIKSLQTLALNSNRISDISSLKPLSNLNELYLGEQKVIGKDVESRNNIAVLDNVVKGVDGKAIIPTASSEYYKYNSSNNTVVFNDIGSTGNKTYTFNQNVYVGKVRTNFNGSVTQKVVYNSIYDVDDANLLAALNEILAEKQGISRPADMPIFGSELESLTGTIDLSNKNIRDLTGLEKCTNITSLILSQNNISNLNAISDLTNLKSLNLDNNKISNVSTLNGLTSLTNLSLANNSINDINGISKLTKLTSLNLSNNGVKNILPIEGLTNLNELNLSENKIINVDALAKLKKLTKLKINGNEIKDITGIGALRDLEVLHAKNNNISDASPLSNLRNLTDANLQGQEIVGKEVEAQGDTAVVNNILKGADGRYISPTESSEYTYDSTTNKITFKNITSTGKKSYSFNENMTVGKTNVSVNFSGKVTQNIIKK